MNVERLRRLENLLRADAANPTGVKFDLGSWAEPDDALKNDPAGDGLVVTVGDYDNLSWYAGEDGKAVPVIPMSCNTHACALGLAALDPSFQAEGLNYRLYKASIGATHGTMIPTCNGESGFEAGQEFFDISHEDARYLFDPDCYGITPMKAEGELFVADRIKGLIEGNIDEFSHPDYESSEDDED